MQDRDGYTEIDLDEVGKGPTSKPVELEIIEESTETPTAQPNAAAEPASKPAETDAEDEDVSEGEAGSKRLNRNQRLKTQRDQYKQALEAERARVAELERKLAEDEKNKQELASQGYDYYLSTLNRELEMAREAFDAAFSSGDQVKLRESQERIADLTVKKTFAERDKQAIPTKRPSSGSEQPPPTRQTTATAQTPKNSLRDDFLRRNKDWYNQPGARNVARTGAALAIDAALTSEGLYNHDDPEYWEELESRLQEAFGPVPTAKAASPPPPTVTARGTLPTNGKIRVKITADDRRMADELGISIEAYARQKARREASGADNYVEIQ